MLRFAVAMLIPLWVFVYTVQFGRWLHKKRLALGAYSAYVIAGLSLLVSSVVLWRVYL
jgi:glucose dehydrogenase